jgi:DNA modification methylase
VDVLTSERDLDAIYQAKLDGMTDEEIIKQFSTDLRQIERAVVKNTGLNLNLIRTPRKFNGFGPKNFLPETSTVWSFKSRGNWATHSGDYRGNWSPYVPRNIMLRYSKPGDLVLDQFCGAGTTPVEAKILGRNCEARDISPAAVELARRNLDFPLSTQEKLGEMPQDTLYEPNVKVGDARDLSDISNASVDLICTHPPYANIIHYSEGIEEDLSYRDIDEFVKEMRIVARECYRVLKPEGVCVFLIGDTRRKKKVIPLGFQSIDVFLDQGFMLKDLIIKRQHNCRTTGFWYSSSIKYNFLLLAQEYLPVFVKPSYESFETRQKKMNPVFPHFTKVTKPCSPDEMQCKTTWVLDSGDFSPQLESNLLNRYGGTGDILTIEFSEQGADGESEFPENVDLVYLRKSAELFRRRAQLKQYLKELAYLLPTIFDKVKSGGHLAIRLKDFRDDSVFFSPALLAWRIPLSLFKIREIVIATSEENAANQHSIDLNINHEYILIYQKE